MGSGSLKVSIGDSSSVGGSILFVTGVGQKQGGSINISTGSGFKYVGGVEIASSSFGRIPRSYTSVVYLGRILSEAQSTKASGSLVIGTSSSALQSTGSIRV